MSKPVHRERDSRICGASTVTRITNVRVNSRAISIEGDTNTHGGGSLKATLTVGKVRAGGIPVILTGDPASPDGLCPIPPHCGPNANSASPNVRAGSGS